MSKPKPKPDPIDEGEISPIEDNGFMYLQTCTMNCNPRNGHGAICANKRGIPMPEEKK